MIRPFNRRKSQSEGQQFGPPLKVELPKEIWVDILSKLNLEDLGQCRQVNKKFNQITAYVAKGSKEDNNHWLFNRSASYSEITLKKKILVGNQINKKMDATPLRCSKMELFMRKSQSLMSHRNIRFQLAVNTIKRCQNTKNIC